MPQIPTIFDEILLDDFERIVIKMAQIANFDVSDIATRLLNKISLENAYTQRQQEATKQEEAEKKPAKPPTQEEQKIKVQQEEQKTKQEQVAETDIDQALPLFPEGGQFNMEYIREFAPELQKILFKNNALDRNLLAMIEQYAAIVPTYIDYYRSRVPQRWDNGFSLSANVSGRDIYMLFNSQIFNPRFNVGIDPSRLGLEAASNAADACAALSDAISQLIMSIKSFPNIYQYWQQQFDAQLKYATQLSLAFKTASNMIKEDIRTTK